MCFVVPQGQEGQFPPGQLPPQLPAIATDRPMNRRASVEVFILVFKLI